MPTLDLTTILVVTVAGFLGGTINAVVGSGTLIVYPALLALGVPPVLANGTNTTGLSMGNFSAAWGYRRELADRASILALPLIVAVLGAVTGALLVIRLPEVVFATIVPWLIIGSCVLVAVQPMIARRLSRRRAPVETSNDQPALRTVRRWPLPVATAAVGVYGGYFGAGQGVILMAVLGAVYDRDIQRANAAKNLLAAVANVTAAITFAVSGQVWWAAAALVAVGAIIGGTLGASVARRLPPVAMRIAVVAVGLLAALSILIRR